MAQSDKFFQFPLCALARAMDERTMISQIIAYGCLEAGRKRADALSPGELDAECEKLDLDEDDIGMEEVSAHMGAKICGVNIGDLRGLISDRDDLHAFHQDWISAHGPDPFVRISTALCFDVRDTNARLSFREFRVLCAIYSALGTHPYRAVNGRTIRVRAVGCKNEATAARKRELGTGGPAPLTEKQIRGTVTRLHETGWFARVTPHRHGRVTYYSNRLSEAALIERIVNKRTFAQSHAARRRDTTAEIARLIAEKKAQLETTPPGPAPRQEETPFPSYEEAFVRDPEGMLPGDGEVSPFLPEEGHHEDVIAASEGPPEGHREGDYNRKPLGRKSPDKKPLEREPMDIPLSHLVGKEEGYVVKGRFIETAQANRFLADNREQAMEIVRLAKRAYRVGEKVEVYG